MAEKKEYVCPDCGKPLEQALSCGSESYFCHECSKLVSRKRIKGHPKYEAEKK